MTITINGNGTVTGVSVGGLPDGIVDTDMLAAGAVTAPKKGAGSILQVVGTGKLDATTTIDCVDIATWYDYTSMNATITPASSSNKILLSFMAMGEGETSDYIYRWRYKRAISGGATTYIAASTAGSRTSVMGMITEAYYADNQDSTPTYFGCSNYLDSPSTTSAITYTLQINCGGANKDWYVNRCTSDTDAQAHERGMGWLTLMEVAG